MKFELLSVFLASAATSFPRAFDYMDSKSCIDFCPTIGCEKEKHCEGVLPKPIHVTSCNYLKNGRLLNIFRKAVKRCCHKKRSSSISTHCKEFTICTKQSLCKVISKDEFCKAVIKTIKCVEKRQDCCSEKQKKVIHHIYNAACKLNVTIDVLINFTSIALHNMYGFCKFENMDKNDVSIGEKCRGLLQHKSKDAYKKLKHVCGGYVDYMAKPYLLDGFTEESIYHEFMAYEEYYSSSCEPSGYSQFINSIKRLAPNESCLLDEKTICELLFNKKKCPPKNDYEKKIVRRFTIYITLSLNVFKSETSTYIARH